MIPADAFRGGPIRMPRVKIEATVNQSRPWAGDGCSGVLISGNATIGNETVDMGYRSGGFGVDRFMSKRSRGYS